MKKKTRPKPERTLLWRAIRRARGIALVDHLKKTTGLQICTAIEERYLRNAAETAERSNLLAKVQRGTRDVPLKRLPPLEAAAPGAIAVYTHPLWDLLDCEDDWSHALVFSCMKRLPDRLSEQLFHPESRYRQGAFARRQDTIHENLSVTSFTDDAFDGLALHLAFFREAELSGKAEDCFLWFRQIRTYLINSVLPVVSKELGGHFLEVIQLGIEQTAERISTGCSKDRDDLLDMFVDLQEA